MSLDFTINRDLYGLGSLEFNITHNLCAMALEVGLYSCLWRPDENYPEPLLARDIAPDVRAGLIRLIKAGRLNLIGLEPTNRWGTYGDLIEFTQEINRSLWRWPLGTVEVSR